MDDLFEFVEIVEWEDEIADVNLNRLEKRYIRDAENPIGFLRDSEFLIRYRFPKEVVINTLLHVVEQDLEKQNQRGLPIPPIIKLLTALRFYATCSFQIVGGDLLGVSQTSVSRLIKAVSQSLARRLPEYIKMPTPGELVGVNQAFYQLPRFPGVIGAIDGTHVKINNPGGPNAEVYRNRKGYFSINVQVVVDSTMKILDLVASRPGSCHDSRIFDNSGIRAKIEEGRVIGLLLGDSGYPCREYLFTPIPNPASRSEERYNLSHIRTRNVVERSIGVWKQRFCCLRRGLGYKLRTTVAIICAVGILHNIAIGHNIPLPPDDDRG